MMRYRMGLLFLLLALLLGLSVSASAQEESLADIARKTKAKKEQSDRKVWTNADFPEREAAPAPAAAAEAGQRSPEELFAELDQARADLASWKETLALYQRGVEQERQRLDEADNDYDREAYGRSLDASQDRVAETEQTIDDLNARIAELEKLTQNLKRPPPKPAEGKKAEAQPAQPPPELIAPQPGPEARRQQEEQQEEQQAGEQQQGEQPPTP
jgi:exonuclease VII large subunit